MLLQCQGQPFKCAGSRDSKVQSPMLILPREPLSHIGEYRHPLLPRLYLSGLFTIDDVQPHQALPGECEVAPHIFFSSSGSCTATSSRDPSCASAEPWLTGGDLFGALGRPADSRSRCARLGCCPMPDSLRSFQVVSSSARDSWKVVLNTSSCEVGQLGLMWTFVFMLLSFDSRLDYRKTVRVLVQIFG